MNGYKGLQVYQRGYEAAKATYRMTEGFPKEERYGIVDQMKRASLSIPLNIAEGYSKQESNAEFKRYLRMAIGSANEMTVLIDFAKDMGYIKEEQHRKAMNEYQEIGKMLRVFIKRVEERTTT